MKNIIVLISLTIYLFSLSCTQVQINKEKKLIKAPFDGEQFNNIEPFPDKSFWQLLKWKFSGNTAKWEDVENQNFYKPLKSKSEETLITMIGHSTILIQTGNLNILTDPHYSDRASPVGWAGPKRVIQPAIKFNDLPKIDIVLISHNHYDHLDLPTLKKLNDKFKPIFLVGLGNASLLEANDIQNITELDWWDVYKFKGLSFHFTPVQHWSARSLLDKRATLWGGFLIEAKKKIFFAGDTGYGKVFKLINEKYGKIDIGLIPIGGYEPSWFMKNAHINPDESLKIFRDLNLSQAFAIHFGTFKNLTDEARNKPINDLHRALDINNLGREKFIVPKFGQAYSF